MSFITRCRTGRGPTDSNRHNSKDASLVIFSGVRSQSKHTHSDRSRRPDQAVNKPINSSHLQKRATHEIVVEDAAHGREPYSNILMMPFLLAWHLRDISRGGMNQDIGSEAGHLQCLAARILVPNATNFWPSKMATIAIESGAWRRVAMKPQAARKASSDKSAR